MKKVIIGDGLSLQDFDSQLEDGEEVEVVIDGKSTIKKIKKTELFDAQVVRLFKHSPNSYEFGKAGNRHKIYYYSKEDGEKKINTAKYLEDKKDEILDGLSDIGKGVRGDTLNKERREEVNKNGTR